MIRQTDFCFPSDHVPDKTWITAAARAHRINRWSHAIHKWIMNNSVPSHEHVVHDDCLKDRIAVEIVYESLKKDENLPGCGTIRHALDCISKWWTSLNILVLSADCQCILDLFVTVGLAVRTTPNGNFGNAVYEYLEPKRE